MNSLEETAPAFVAMAHRIVWGSIATVDAKGRPRSRVLHPIWEWDGNELVGWVGTGPTPTKRAHLDASPFASINYWEPGQDTCVAECRATWCFDVETRKRIWEAYKSAPPPLGYDPAIIPVWTAPEADTFAVLRFDPWRVRVFPGSALAGQTEGVRVWQAGGS
ncbi:MAG: pyridoxamine 5'-phosphate oxidase family protein [Proteobacteria bacterium]|nr:pyridoxamine 5'-phosphate oxidase family protein [Pseudomonadota bacterium]